MIHSYGRHRHQHGELLLPASGPAAPVAVLIHGGFWRARYGRRLMDGLCRDLAAAGWAAWNLEYRRLGVLSGGGYPETLEDVAAGIDALADLDVPIDLGTVVAIGHSAGGHLALWAAAREESRVPVTHAVGQAAVSDLAEAIRLGLSGGAARRIDGPGASPIERLPLSVPQLLVHGARDDIVPVSMSRRYHEAALAARDPADLVVLPEAGHFEHIDPASKAWGAVRAWLP